MSQNRLGPDGPTRAGRWRRRLQARLRLLSATLVGVVAALAFPVGQDASLRATIGWDTGTALYLVLILIMMAQATPETMRWRASVEDEARWVFLGDDSPRLAEAQEFAQGNC